MRTSLLLFSVLCFSAGTVAQTPEQKPCALELAACEVEILTKTLRLAKAEKEIASLRAQLNDAGNNLAAERDNSASLASKNAEKDQAIAGQRETIATVTVERDKLAQKIAKANRRWNCKVLHLGCIGER